MCVCGGGGIRVAGPAMRLDCATNRQRESRATERGGSGSAAGCWGAHPAHTPCTCASRRYCTVHERAQTHVRVHGRVCTGARRQPCAPSDLLRSASAVCRLGRPYAASTSSTPMPAILATHCLTCGGSSSSTPAAAPAKRSDTSNMNVCIAHPTHPACGGGHIAAARAHSRRQRRHACRQVAAGICVAGVLWRAAAATGVCSCPCCGASQQEGTWPRQAWPEAGP